MDASGSLRGSLLRGAGLTVALVVAFVACTSEPPLPGSAVGTGGAPSTEGGTTFDGSLGGTGPSGGGTFGAGSGGRSASRATTSRA